MNSRKRLIITPYEKTPIDLQTNDRLFYLELGDVVQQAKNLTGYESERQLHQLAASYTGALVAGVSRNETLAHYLRQKSPSIYALLDVPAHATPTFFNAIRVINWGVVVYLKPKTFGMRWDTRVYFHSPRLPQ